MGLEMGRDTSTKPEAPRVIRMHPADNVAIVVNDFGAPAGAKLLSGLTLHEYVPQGHKVALHSSFICFHRNCKQRLHSEGVYVCCASWAKYTIVNIRWKRTQRDFSGNLLNSASINGSVNSAR
jgi:hypothetical protein